MLCSLALAFKQNDLSDSKPSLHLRSYAPIYSALVKGASREVIPWL